MITKFASGVGSSNGCAEFTLKKPPPLVPRFLIAICDAAGPSATSVSTTGLPSTSFVLSTNVAVAYGENVCTTPCETRNIASTIESGTST